MKRIFISSVQKEFERERAAIKRMVETDPIIRPHFSAFVFELDAPAADKSIQRVYSDEIAKSDIYLVLIGNRYGCQLNEELSGRFRIVIWRGKSENRQQIKTFNDARIIALVTENGNLTLSELADKLQIKYATLRTRIEMLKKRGLRHEGSRKAGKWVWRP